MKIIRSLYPRQPQKERDPERSKTDGRDDFVTQLYVFRGEVYLGWDCFAQDSVMVGSGKCADFVLEGSGVAEEHLEIRSQGENVFVQNMNNAKRDSEPMALGALETVNIGEYSLKIKRKRVSRPQPEEKNRAAAHADEDKRGVSDKRDTGPKRKNLSDEKYCIVYSGETVQGVEKEKTTQTLKKLLKRGDEQIQRLLSGVPAVVKKTDDLEKAKRVQRGMTKYGLKTEIVTESKLSEVTENATTAASIEKSDTKIDAKEKQTETEGLKEPLSEKAEKDEMAREKEGDSVEKQEATVPSETETRTAFAAPVENISTTTPAVNAKYDDDDEEDEDCEADFSLLEKFQVKRNGEIPRNDDAKQKHLLLEVVKCRRGAVVDVRFLKAKEKYQVENGKGRFCLAENKSSLASFVYFKKTSRGSIRRDASNLQEISESCEDGNLYSRRKGIYRMPIGANDAVAIEIGVFEYKIRPTYERTGPEIAEPPKSDAPIFRYLVKSSLFHLVLLTFLGLFPTFTPPDPPPPETHFVKIDPHQLAAIEKRIAPPKPKPVLPKTTPQQPKPIVKKESKKVQVARRKARTATRKAVASRHPKAGGGYGKGNIKNRNINQTGILSMLGDTVGLKPQEAMAAVTNLDAVTSTGKPKSGFTVGGIVGKLGDGKIALPSSGIVNTKGSTQVLRSAGASGEGRVAALEKGKTGQKQVMGMVSAKLSKTVRVQGGMSREAVKRVIDQHLDEISYCYETALVANPSIMGKVIFEWKILMSGKVGSVAIKSSSINSNEIHSCIQAAIRTWQFPEPKGNEVMVSYPFIFDIVGF